MAVSEDVQFLGSAMLISPMMATGLGALQRPLIELYAASFESKTGNPLMMPLRRLTITERGLIITASDSASEEQDTFYSMPHVMFWEAVKFVHVRIGDKKFRGAFEPIGERQMAKDNLYMDLEKQCYHLAKSVKQHASLIVLVLRRPTGLKALELQAYACGSARHATHVVECLGAAQTSYGAQQAHESNVFNYTAFDRGDVSSVTGGMQVINTVSPMSGVRMVDDSRRRQAATVSAFGQSALQLVLPTATSQSQVQGVRADGRARNSNSTSNAGLAPISESSSFSQSMYDLNAPRQNKPHSAASARGARSEAMGTAALEGYYDMPPAVRLPILGGPSRAEESTSDLQPKSGSRPIGRSKTFRDSPSAATDTVSVSVLHRPLIQQSMDDVRGDLGTTSGPGGGKDKLRSQPGNNVDRVTPIVAPRSKPTRSQTFRQGPETSADVSARQASGRPEERSQPSSNPVNSPPGFLFGFDAAPLGNKQKETTTTTTTTTAADKKPVAMVQPRKVAGVRVIPDNMDISASPVYQNKNQMQQQRQQQQQQQPPETVYQLSKTPNALATPVAAFGNKHEPFPDARASKSDQQRGLKSSSVPYSNSDGLDAERRPGGGVGGGGGGGIGAAAAGSGGGQSVVGRSKDTKTDGIASLRTLRGNPSATASGAAGSSRPSVQTSGLFSDINSNNVKAPIYGNIGPMNAQLSTSPPAATTTSPTTAAAAAAATAAASNAANNFELLMRLSSDQSRGDRVDGGHSTRHESPKPSRKREPAGPMIVDGSEDMSSKDKEIASVVGNMRIDYEPSTATLQAQGTNFEKYLGYFP